MPTHERFRIRLFIRTTHKRRMSGITLLSSYKTTFKQQFFVCVAELCLELRRMLKNGDRQVILLLLSVVVVVVVVLMVLIVVVWWRW